ncbi:MAG: CBM66 [uncultured Thermomicrobiales bacterium]|uniref:CBM66 n=1 Tax=uncultured Thermomicrobiales bacterium TaxID=1645740 RepID=A0A6J4UG19_9BACT|nr:MAG: CBM66 [uncultured Thermomicrobiales bacterium]
MPLPTDYVERVYAGVLGKLIGVYLGRPVESWTYERITREIGEIDRYMPEVKGGVLVVTDDDISGTFTFLRSLPDHGNRRDLTPEQIGQSWLNYIVETRTILWWGGMGNSTEHTAFLRLQAGVPAPRSGSIELNSKMIAEQIGSQIFIDGWAMVAPGDPELAADLARRAGSVSHDGEAIYGAQVIAAMEAQAFVESDVNKLLDTALTFIPADSTIARLIDDVRGWHAKEPDWRVARDLIAANYGYDKYRGNCHMVPNHALIIHALLYGDDDFKKSLTIVNTSGWDTDCNSGNLGCLLGIKNGLATIDESPYDWRGPVADRLYLSTADGGRAITDAVAETYHVVNMGRSLAGEAPLAPKGGARFHFELPGSVQGFEADGQGATVTNVAGNSVRGQRSLKITAPAASSGTSRVATPTFIPEEAKNLTGYTLIASPTLYPGQTVRAGVAADGSDGGPTTCRLFLRTYDGTDGLRYVPGPEVHLEPGATSELVWPVGEMGGQPIAQVGIEVGRSDGSAGDRSIYLDYLDWDGAPDVTFHRPADDGTMWRRAWMDGVDDFRARWPEPYRIVKNHGTGLISQGTAEWVDYRADAKVKVYLAPSGGLAVRVGGLRRYYALTLCDDGHVRLVKAMDGETTLAEVAFAWEFDRWYELAVEVTGSRIRGWIDGEQVLDASDGDQPLTGGGVGLVVTEGCLGSEAVRVGPAAA